jgi:hypothetical protein
MFLFGPLISVLIHVVVVQLSEAELLHSLPLCFFANLTRTVRESHKLFGAKFKKFKTSSNKHTSTMATRTDLDIASVHPEDVQYVKKIISERLPKGVPSTPVQLPRTWNQERKERVVMHPYA